MKSLVRMNDTSNWYWERPRNHTLDWFHSDFETGYTGDIWELCKDVVHQAGSGVGFGVFNLVLNIIAITRIRGKGLDTGFSLSLVAVLVSCAAQAIGEIEYYAQVLLHTNGHHQLKNPFARVSQGFGTILFILQRFSTGLCIATGVKCTVSGRKTNIVAILIAIAVLVTISGLISIPAFLSVYLTGDTDLCGVRFLYQTDFLEIGVKCRYNRTLGYLMLGLSILFVIILAVYLLIQLLKSKSTMTELNPTFNRQLVRTMTICFMVLTVLVDVVTTVKHYYVHSIIVYEYHVTNVAIYLLMSCYPLIVLVLTRPPCHEVVSGFSRVRSSLQNAAQSLNEDVRGLGKKIQQIRTSGWKAMRNAPETTAGTSDVNPLVTNEFSDVRL